MKTAPYTLTATEAAAAIAAGRLSSVDLVKSCLARIEETDGAIKAWAHLDPAAALAQAAECDRIRRAGYAIGALHGVPVALQDILDPPHLPTPPGPPSLYGPQTATAARLV